MILYTDRASLSKWDARFLALAEHIFINAGVECLFMFEGA
jgi:hypothetical protein